MSTSETKIIDRVVGIHEQFGLFEAEILDCRDNGMGFRLWLKVYSDNGAAKEWQMSLEDAKRRMAIIRSKAQIIEG